MKKKKIMITNRGEIAVRIIRACKEMGIESVLACSEADLDSMGARMADKTVVVGPWQAAKSYLNIEALIAAAIENGCDAIHPGYGFLAENPAFSEACEKHGLIFIGPRSETMKLLGNKSTARQVAMDNHVPMTKGTMSLSDFWEAEAAADEIGYPVIIKATAGGGGRGMRIVYQKEALKAAFDTATAEAKSGFGDSTLFLEAYVQNARHVEVEEILNADASDDRTVAAAYGSSWLTALRKWAIELVRGLLSNPREMFYLDDRSIIRALHQHNGRYWLSSLMQSMSGSAHFPLYSFSSG